MDSGKTIIWSEPAKDDLKQIFEYITVFSLQSAENVVFGILDKVEQLSFLGFEYSGMTDDINPNYRRLVEGNYKILYKIYTDIIIIHGIFDARQSPEKLKIR